MVEKDTTLLELGGALVLLLGLPGNMFVIVVINRMKRHFQAFSFFFLALIVSDTALLLFALLPRWAESIAHSKFDDPNKLMCKVVAWIYYTGFMASSWYLTAMIVVRALGSTWSQALRSKHAICLCKVAIWFIPLLSGVLPIMYSDQVQNDDCYLGSRVRLAEGTGAPWAWLNFMLIFLVPFAIIAFCNIWLIFTLRASSQRVIRNSKRSIAPILQQVRLHKPTPGEPNVLAKSPSRRISFTLPTLPTVTGLGDNTVDQKTGHGETTPSYTSDNKITPSDTISDHKVNQAITISDHKGSQVEPKVTHDDTITEPKVTPAVTISDPKVTPNVKISDPRVTLTVRISDFKVTPTVTISDPKMISEVAISGPKVTPTVPISDPKVTSDIAISDHKGISGVTISDTKLTSDATNTENKLTSHVTVSDPTVSMDASSSVCGRGCSAKLKLKGTLCQLMRKHSMLLLLLMSVLVFGMLIMPKWLVDALVASSVLPQSSLPEWVEPLLELLAYCNAAVKFYLYCITGTSFRNEIASVLKRGQTSKLRGSKMSHTRTSTTDAVPSIFRMSLTSGISSTSRVEPVSFKKRKTGISKPKLVRRSLQSSDSTDLITSTLAR